MEINITDHLSQDEIKEIVQDEIRLQIRNHFKTEENANRLLSNLAYHMVQEEIDKIVPNHKELLIHKVAEVLENVDSVRFCLLNYDYSSGAPKSLAAKIIEQTVKENTDLIKSKVIEAIETRDYSEDTWNKFETLCESFTSNLYDFMDLVRNKKINQ
jgi:hypothetical protein